jgi:hypothetical protein
MKTGFFQEDNGNYSMMRLMSFIALLSAMGWALIVGLCIPVEKMNEWHFLMFLAFLTVSFAPKVFQKFAEQKMGIVCDAASTDNSITIEQKK